MVSGVNGEFGKKYHLPLIFLLSGVTLFRLFYIQIIELAPDEAYYWTWSKQLQWGYYDHPPMVAFLIYLFTKFAGDNEFGLRLGWVIIGALLTYLVYRLSREMFRSQATGFYSAFLMNIILVMATGAIIATPDGPQAFFWVLAIYLLWAAINKDNNKLWYGLGIALGLGMLAKYTMVLLVPCVFFFLLSFPQGRKWLRCKEPYLALLIGFLIFSPVIFWNYEHQWLSFRMQLAHGLEIKEGAGWKTWADFWAGQAGVVSPLLFFLLIWAMIQSARRGYNGQINFLLLFWTSAPVLSFFAYTSLRSKVEANWPALAYFSAVVALVWLVREKWKEWRCWPRRLIWVAGLIAFLSTGLAHLQPIYALIPISAAHDPTSQLSGWRILGEGIKSVARSVAGEKEVFLLTPQHQLVGEAMFYTQRRYAIYQWEAPKRINNLAVSNAPPDGSSAIYFTENEEDLPEKIAALFQSCTKLEPLIVYRKSEIVRVHPMWHCHGFKRNLLISDERNRGKN